MKQVGRPAEVLSATLSLLVALLAATACGGAASASVEEVATTVAPEFTLFSAAISDGRLLPEYRCELKVDGVEDSIPLSWSNVPPSARSLAIIMHHYPRPGDTSIVSSYLLLWGIDPSVSEIPHGAASQGDWYMGSNKDGTAVSYTSPCSQGSGTHEYTITIYALSETPPSLPKSSTVEVDYKVLKEAIETVTVIDTATLTFVDVTP